MNISSSTLPNLRAPRSVLRLWLWQRRRAGRSAWQELRRTPIKLAVVVSVWSVLLLGVYALAREGFAFLYRESGVGAFLLDRLWYLFAFVIGIMLLVSQCVTAYSTLVRSRETAWWMSLPLPPRGMARAKWLESSVYSAWAVLALIVPLGMAYVRTLERAVWHLGWLLVVLVPLIGCVTALATLGLLCWLRWVGPIPFRRELLPIGLVAIGVAVFWTIGGQPDTPKQDAWFIALQELIPRMHLASSPWVPSSWMARSVNAWMSRRWVEAGLFCALLWSTCAVSVRLLDHAAHGLLLPVIRRAHDGRVDGQPRRAAARADASEQPAWWAGRPFVSCIAKDLLLLARDPMQWSQGLVFFGILGAYFANIHRVTRMAVDPSWRIGVASLNLACTLLVLGSLAVRFLFPQMSLEGKCLWFMQTVPAGLRRLLYAKLMLYGAVALVLVEGLLLVSAMRLSVPLPMVWWLAGIGVLAALSLVGFSVGFGAVVIDPQVSDPARFVSSSNGALALLLMLVYVAGVSWSLAVAWGAWVHRDALSWIVASAAVGLSSWLFGYLPIRLGLRTLERLEL